MDAGTKPALTNFFFLFSFLFLFCLLIDIHVISAGLDTLALDLEPTIGRHTCIFDGSFFQPFIVI